MAAAIDTDDLEALPASLRNVVEQKSLQWIFIGGKGGVGKTTTSCCLSIQLAKVRGKVLVVSTDPAHNLSDAFAQKFGKDPTQVAGYDNLFCMEIDPEVDIGDELAELGDDAGASGIASLMGDLTKAVPGIDEAMSFAELMKQVQSMDYDVIVFDTAPTGHTLRLLSFPSTIGAAMDKVCVPTSSVRQPRPHASATGAAASRGRITRCRRRRWLRVERARMSFALICCTLLSHNRPPGCVPAAQLPPLPPPSVLPPRPQVLALKNQFAGMIPQISAMMGGQMPSEEMMLGKLEAMREVSRKKNSPRVSAVALF